MSFTLNILGCSSATPTTWSSLSAQVLEMEGKYFLIDCGEGTQVELRRNKLPFSKIDNIFISHLHGDHFFGLVGLLSSFSLLNRTKDLNVYSPKGLKDIIINQFRAGKSNLSYMVNFVEIEGKQMQTLFENDKLTVSSFPLKHRIETYGFLFVEKEKLRKLDKVKCEYYKIDIADYRNVQLGKDVVNSEGKLIPNTFLSHKGPKILSYAYCSDTAYHEKVAEYVKGVDLLYHESTFIEKNVQLAKKTGHSTAKQAAEIAAKAQVAKLMLGHFSARYRDRNVYLDEAKIYFDQVILAESGLSLTFQNQK